MAPKFGTSGLRGLVTELTEPLVQDYVRAFLAACPTGGAVHVGYDLRPSSPRIAAMVRTAVLHEGLDIHDCGAVPTPALALASMARGHGAVMVTGSHIPADRNGLKFYVPTGEISKADETAILDHLGRSPAGGAAGRHHDGQGAVAAYTARYVDAFGAQALAGWRIGVYQHSSVARDIMMDVVQSLGGTPLALAPSDVFIPVDTEALDASTREMLANWCSTHALDAVISTDGDADRPMVADASGTIIPGDILGALTAQSLGADVICTPVSSNSMIADMPAFKAIHLTRIGSPFVIAAMENVLQDAPQARVVGYEANGGFLLGFTARGPAGDLTPLMTRDCLLPMLAPMAAARQAGVGLAAHAATLPQRFTAADRLAGIPSDAAQAFLQRLSGQATARAAFFAGHSAETAIDLTDGLRTHFEDKTVVHLRPSGNAPEFRCYAEADSADRARGLVDTFLKKIASEFS